VTVVRTLRRTVTGVDELRQTLVLVSAIVCFETILFTVLGPLLPRLADQFDLSKRGAGLLVASYAAGAFLGAVPSGLSGSRIGARATALGGLVLLGTASALFGMATGEVWLFLARLLQGFGCALAWTGGLAWLLARTPRERRGHVVGIALGAAVGGALLGPAVGALAGSIGTRPVFVGLGLPAFALAAWGASMPGGAAEELIPFDVLRRALAQSRLLVSALMIVLAGFLLGVVSALAPLHLARLGWTTTGVGAIFVLAAALNTAVNPMLGRWSDRSGRIVPLRAALVLAFTSSLALASSPGRWLYAAIVFGGVACYALLWTPAMVLLSDVSDERGLGFVAGFALMNLAWSPGQFVGSAFAGAAAQATSDAVPFAVAAALCIAALGSLRWTYSR
jgi:MFS family permease